MPISTQSSTLLEYVKRLENRSNPERCQQVLLALHSMGIEPATQDCRLLRIKNIIVDFQPQSTGKKLLFSAHYDAVKGSPGANDNASGVAVLLGLCREMKDRGIPLKIVFFDREEAWFRTPWLRLGLLGSLYYVLIHRLNRVSAVYNLEFCGQGEVLGVWPVKPGQRNLPAVRSAQQAAASLGLDFKTAHLPWLLLSSDHLSFRLRGLSNAVTLTQLSRSQIPLLENMLSAANLPGLLFRKRPDLPEPLSQIHSQNDTSFNLNEEALQRMLAVILEIIKVPLS